MSKRNPGRWNDGASVSGFLHNTGADSRLIKSGGLGLSVLLLCMGILFYGCAGMSDFQTLSPIPEELPDPSGQPPAKDKPVKVYIMSGQSNMVGMGEIGPGGMSRYNTYVAADKGAKNGCIVSVYKGEYDPDVNYDQKEPVKTFHARVGYWPHKSFPECEENPCTQIARGFIRIDRKGEYSFRSGNILKIDGEVVYRNEPDKDSVKKRVTCEKGVYPIEVIHFGRGKTYLGYSHWDIPGTLTTLVKQEGKFPHLLDEDGNWTVRNDVIYKGVVSAGGQGPLKPGVQRGGTIGPQLGFGHVMGYYHDEPVLLIKASIGNRSLGWDILPPGSERYTYEGRVYAGYKDPQSSWPVGEKPKPGGWYAGKTYDRFTKAIHGVLNDFDKLFPQFKDQGYEIAGFVWWQGHKDGGSEAHIAHYEQNLVRLIEAWRQEFQAPKAPWAIATVGFGGRNMAEKYMKILEAQKAVADPQQHPELADTVITVDIRPFWREADVSPKAQGYHYNRNAETYYLVGDALGRGMVQVKSEK